MRDILDLKEAARQRIRQERLQVYGIKTISSADLAAKQFPPIRWAVPNLLPEGYGLLGGRPKIGKSWLALDLALAVALGSCALGSKDYRAPKGTVLYLALEDNERRLQARQARLLQGGSAPADLHIATEWKRLDDGGLEALEQWLGEYPDTRLIIIDTLVRAKPRLKRGADAYEHEMDVGALLQGLAHKHRTCVLAIHHTRKTPSENSDFIDEITGSTGITAAPDFVAKLSRGRREDTGLLEITGKDLPEIELALKFTACAWVLLGDAREYQVSRTQELVLDCLRQSPEALSPREIADTTELTEAYVKKTLRNLIDAGLVARASRGRYSLQRETNLYRI